MPSLRLDLDRETYDHLLSRAEAERRPVAWQAEVMLRRAVGLPFPHDQAAAGAGAQQEADDVRRA